MVFLNRVTQVRTQTHTHAAAHPYGLHVCASQLGCHPLYRGHAYSALRHEHIHTHALTTCLCHRAAMPRLQPSWRSCSPAAVLRYVIPVYSHCALQRAFSALPSTQLLTRSCPHLGPRDLMHVCVCVCVGSYWPQHDRGRGSQGTHPAWYAHTQTHGCIHIHTHTHTHQNTHTYTQASIPMRPLRVLASPSVRPCDNNPGVYLCVCVSVCMCCVCVCVCVCVTHRCEYPRRAHQWQHRHWSGIRSRVKGLQAHTDHACIHVSGETCAAARVWSRAAANRYVCVCVCARARGMLNYLRARSPSIP